MAGREIPLKLKVLMGTSSINGEFSIAMLTGWYIRCRERPKIVKSHSLNLDL